MRKRRKDWKMPNGYKIEKYGGFKCEVRTRIGGKGFILLLLAVTSLYFGFTTSADFLFGIAMFSYIASLISMRIWSGALAAMKIRVSTFPPELLTAEGEPMVSWWKMSRLNVYLTPDYSPFIQRKLVIKGPTSPKRDKSGRSQVGSTRKFTISQRDLGKDIFKKLTEFLNATGIAF